MKNSYIVIVGVSIGYIIGLGFQSCKSEIKHSEYERGWYNACNYIVWKNNHRAELPCVVLLEFSEGHPDVDFNDSLFISVAACGSGGKPNGWITDTLRIHDTVDVCNPSAISIPDGYEQDRIEAKKIYDKWDAMSLRRICGCPKSGDSPQKEDELENKYKSFRSVKHDKLIFDKEVTEFKKELCK